MDKNIFSGHLLKLYLLYCHIFSALLLSYILLIIPISLRYPKILLGGTLEKKKSLTIYNGSIGDRCAIR